MEIYIVKKGDTIWSIAQKYAVSAEYLAEINGISAPYVLCVGQALLVLIPDIVHVVAASDTLYSIAKRYNSSVQRVLSYNPSLTLSSVLYVGQKLVISFRAQSKGNLVLNGYAYPYIESYVLKGVLPFLSSLTVFGYGIAADGSLVPIQDTTLIAEAKAYQSAPVMLLSSVTENGTFDNTRASRIFRDTTLQNKLIADILVVLKSKGYAGLDVDFEFIPPEDAPFYYAFLENLANKLHQNGYKLHVDLAPKTTANQQGLLYESHNYKRIGEIADTVLIMTYEWGYTYGPPLAVAPIQNVTQVVRYAVSEISPDKIMLGIPNYGYDWILPYEKGTTRATAIGNEYAIDIAVRNGASISFDQQAMSPFFYYTDQDGRSHVVWFEDVRSMEAKLTLIHAFALRGGSFWNVMRPFRPGFILTSALYNITKPEF